VSRCDTGRPRTRRALADDSDEGVGAQSPVAEAFHMYFLAWKVKSAGNGLVPKVTPDGERCSVLSVAPLKSLLLWMQFSQKEE
jgi:hypothetical protein